jgi:hypothetical protein
MHWDFDVRSKQEFPGVNLRILLSMSPLKPPKAYNELSCKTIE